MSMIGNFYMLEQHIVEDIQAGKLSLAEDILYNEEKEPDGEDCLDIDKTWHAIHFILTGQAGKTEEATGENTVLSKLIFSGNLLTDEDVGYGPAMLITQAEVKEIAKEIQGISRELLYKSFDLSTMLKNGVYPMINDEDEDGFFEYVWQYFEEIQRFFRVAAQENKCVIFYIN